jgi:hypothetical protein
MCPSTGAANARLALVEERPSCDNSIGISGGHRLTARRVARVPGELLVRCQDLEEPGAFYRAYRRRLQAGFRFVYDDPRLGEGDSLQALLERLRAMDAPPEFLHLIARDTNPRIRAAVAGNANLAPEDLQTLARDLGPVVRRGAAVHPWATPSLLRAMAGDPEEIVREQVAAHLATPPDVLLEFTRHAVVRNATAEYLTAIAEHPRAPAEALTLLALIPMRDGWVVARRPNLPRMTIDQILEAGPERCRADLARNPTLDPDTLALLARDSAPPVRIAAARNPRTAPETIELLLRDPDPAVRAANPQSTPLDLIRLVDVRSRAVTEQVASNPVAPQSLLDRLARTWDSDVHAAVAANPSTAPETLRHLFRAGSDQVRRLCLENPACPEDLLRARAQARGAHWRAVIAANPSTPQDVLLGLAADPSPEVIAALAGNPSSSQALQRRLLREPAGLPTNPMTPPDLLWRLAIYENNDHYARRRQVLGNPAFSQAYEVVTTWRETQPGQPPAASVAPSE